MNDRHPIVATDGRFDYRVMELIGQEPGGELYIGEAVSRDQAEPVSIRTFNDRDLVDARFRDRLLEAVKLHRELKHPAIHPIRSFVELHHSPAVISEPLEGRRLSELVRSGPLPMRPVAAMGQQLASGLHALHASGVGGGRGMGRTHQDLHPDNILLTHGGQARLLEVGTARARIALDRPDIRGQAPVPAYTAPERRKETDRAEADVYALAVVLVEALTGHSPEPLPDAPDAHAREVSQFVASLTAVPASVRALLQEMLSFDPDARPSAREVGRRLRALVPDLEGPWLSAWTGEHVPAPAPPRAVTAQVFEEAEAGSPKGKEKGRKAKQAPIEVLRPLRKVSGDKNGNGRLVTAVSIVGMVLVALVGGVILTQPDQVSRFWLTVQGYLGLDEVIAELEGERPTQGRITKMTPVDKDAKDEGGSARPDEEAAPPGATVVDVDGTAAAAAAAEGSGQVVGEASGDPVGDAQEVEPGGVEAAEPDADLGDAPEAAVPEAVPTAEALPEPAVDVPDADPTAAPEPTPGETLAEQTPEPEPVLEPEPEAPADTPAASGDALALANAPMDAAPAGRTPPAAEPEALVATLGVETNPEVAQPAGRITRRNLQRRMPIKPAVAAFGEDFEAAPANAPRVVIEVRAPLATNISVVCADGVRGAGEGRVRMNDVPAGRCNVRAIMSGKAAYGDFRAASDRRVECRLEFADKMRCF